jgi:hypothetical protein
MLQLVFDGRHPWRAGDKRTAGPRTQIEGLSQKWRKIQAGLEPDITEFPFVQLAAADAKIADQVIRDLGRDRFRLQRHEA